MRSRLFGPLLLALFSVVACSDGGKPTAPGVGGAGASAGEGGTVGPTQGGAAPGSSGGGARVKAEGEAGRAGGLAAGGSAGMDSGAGVPSAGVTGAGVTGAGVTGAGAPGAGLSGAGAPVTTGAAAGSAGSPGAAGAAGNSGNSGASGGLAVAGNPGTSGGSGAAGTAGTSGVVGGGGAGVPGGAAGTGAGSGGLAGTGGVASACDPATYVPDTSCFLPGVCTATHQASSCVGGTVLSCRPGNKKSARDGTCDGLDDDCDGTADEDVSCGRSDRTAFVVAVIDAEAARLLGPDPVAALGTAFAQTSALYASANFTPVTNVKLGAVITWGSTPGMLYPTETAYGTDYQDLMTHFTTWVQTNRSALSTMAGSNADQVLLITGKTLAAGNNGQSCEQQAQLGITPCQNGPASQTGLGWVGTMCGAQSAAYAQMQPGRSLVALGQIIAHELGHNFGMQHDVTSGYVMSASMAVSGSPVFSAASKTYLANFFATSYGTSTPACLGDLPSFGPEVPRCGDGRTDSGEQCDPGTGTADSCCTVTCQLAPGCSCPNSDPCCTSGQPSAISRVCRPATGECDLAETCDGVSSACHRDLYRAPGTACGTTDCTGATAPGKCLRGACVSAQAACRAPNNCSYASAVACATQTCGGMLNCSSSAAAPTCDITWAQQVLDGLACGASSQCSGNACVASSSLKDYAWQYGAWSSCSAGTRTRTATCQDETGTAVAQGLCTGTPLLSQACP